MIKEISFVDLCLLIAGLYITKQLVTSRRSGLLPPGPTGWPVIGYLFQISSEKNWEDFAALGRKYGTHYPSSYELFSRLYYCLRGHFVHEHPGDALCRSQLVQGHLGGT